MALNKIWCVGLTGGIASGKSTVGTLFTRLGATVIDTDLVNAKLIGPGGRALPALRAAFGKDAAQEDGGLDRATMRELVFKVPARRIQLESILHPLIREEVDQALHEATGPYAVLVIPLLFETGFFRDRLDRILVVDLDPALQRQRAIQRPGVTPEQVDAILSIQCSRDERLLKADDVIPNSGDLEGLEQAVGALHQTYLGLSRGSN